MSAEVIARMVSGSIGSMPLRRLGTLFALLGAGSANAADLGVSSLGATGGLAIPSAQVLAPGEVAASFGNDQDPKLGHYSHRRNYSLGFGLGYGLELFGRLADYQNPVPVPPGAMDVNGPRDLSANLKWQLPLDRRWPRVALGVTDPGGGAVLFKSAYGVVSDEAGPLRWSLGYAKSQGGLVGSARSFDGPFGGVELRLFETRATALLETDGGRKLAGLRYTGEPLPWLGQAQVIASIQRSFSASDASGQPANASAFNLTLVMPMSLDDAGRQRRARTAERSAALPELPSLSAPGPSATEDADVAALAARLTRAMNAAGLDRVRVGVRPGELVVEYQNAAYLHSEADALGVALGLASENAPPQTPRLRVAALRAGLPVLWAATEVRRWREWLREETSQTAALQVAEFGLGADWRVDDVAWTSEEGRALNRVRVSLRPMLAYTLGTEFGVFDHALAVLARTSVPLWKGAEIYADVVEPVSHSDNVEPNRAFGNIRQIGGIRTFALQQSLWLGPRVFASVGAGRYLRNRFGVEGESVVFLPGANHSLHLRGQLTRAIEDDGRGSRGAWTGAYRWRATSDLWIEGNVNQFTDGTRGPGAAISRWFGDVKLTAFARKGGHNKFVGLELSLPLAPRRGMDAAPVQVTGTPRFDIGMRTLLTDAVNTGNWVRPDAARSVDLGFRAESELLDAGRITPDWLNKQLVRMRETFLLHARERVH